MNKAVLRLLVPLAEQVDIPTQPAWHGAWCERPNIRIGIDQRSMANLWRVTEAKMMRHFLREHVGRFVRDHADLGRFILALGIVTAGGYNFYSLYETVTRCDLAVQDSIPSPSGKRSAVIYEMGCGATDSFNTQVSVAPSDRPFSPEQNPSFLSLHGQHALGVKWVGERVIEIGLPEGKKIYRNDPAVDDITIEYR